MSVFSTISNGIRSVFGGGKRKPAVRKTTRSKQASQSNQVTLQLGSYGGLMPVYTPGDNFADNEAYVTCVETNATYCSKAEFSSVRIMADGEHVHDYKSLDKLLQLSPNPLMPAAVFWERVRTFYDIYANSFIFVEKDSLGNIIAFWSIDPNAVEFAKVKSGEIILRFQLNGANIIESYSNILHIQRNVTSNAIFGTRSQAIQRVINLINTNTKGVENAILHSTLIRFLGEVNTKTNEKDLKKRAKAFSKSFLNVNPDDPVAVAFTDSTVKMTELKQADQKTANYKETTSWNESIYKFMGCPETVIAGTANDEEMTSYYERTLEPFFERVTQEMTRKLFTDREYEMGNRIVFKSQKLLYQSMSTRLNIFSAVRELGVFTLGTLGDLLGLPVPKGQRNKVLISQNYMDSAKSQSNNENNNDNKEKNDDGSDGE